MNYKNKYSYSYIDDWIQFIKYNKKTKPSTDYKKALLITGPSGVGKTTCLYNILHSYDYNITEFNLLDFKNHSLIKEHINNILHYKNIQALFNNTQNNKIIIFNEIDKISLSDRSIVNNVIKYIRSHIDTTTSFIPIIFKGNTYTNYFSTIKEVAMYLSFPLPTDNDIFLFCKEYVHTQRMSLTDVQIQCLIEYFIPNFRLIKNNLDIVNFYIQKHKKFSLPKIKQIIKNNQSDIDIDMYQSVYELLNTKQDLLTCEHIMSKDTKYILLLLHKNILSYIQYNTKNTFTNKLKQIYDIYTYFNYSTHILYNFDSSNRLFLYNYVNSSISVLCNSIVNNKHYKLDYGKFSTIQKSPIYSKLNYKFCNLKYINIITTKININPYNFQMFSHYLYYIIQKYKIKKYTTVLKKYISTKSIQSKELDKIFKLNYLNKLYKSKKKKSYYKIYKECMKIENKKTKKKNQKIKQNKSRKK